MVAFLSPAGKHLVFLAVSGVNDVVTVIQHSESGQPLIHVRLPPSRNCALHTNK